LLHVHKKPAILFKADISKAFDSVASSFLLELLLHMGFPNGKINWITKLLLMASTKVLLNREPGMRIRHRWGLRQGDPLSPTLFILVMEVVNTLFCKVDDWSLFCQLGASQIKHRASHYVDNLIVFLTPVAPDLELARGILMIFEGASALA
jgi:hypothetical protein